MVLPKPEFTEAQVHAMRSLIAGKATADEQRTAMRCILEQICRIYDTPYVADGTDRDTFVALGRHQVGVLITSTTTERVLMEAQARGRQKDAPAPRKRGTR